MSAADAGPHRVLIVDGDARIRLALTELINATDGFTVVAAVDAPDEFVTRDRDTAPASPNVAVVGIHPGDQTAGLAHVRALAGRLPVLAVATSASLRAATTAAGATGFCEMDGNPERLIAALHAAAHQLPTPTPNQSPRRTT